MFSIRPATDEDNKELLELETLCPQGTNLVLQFDRSPDFFRRSRTYDSYNIYIARDEGKTIGTIGSTVRNFNLNGKRTTGVYIYDLRVHPDHRGRRIGSKLIQHVTNKSDEVQMAYGIIAEDNYPSLALFKKMGFQKAHDFVLFNIPLYKRQPSVPREIRTITNHDAPQVVELINEHYRNCDFFSPLSATDFLNKTEKLPGYGLDKIQIATNGSRITACLGLWDYSEIFRVSTLRVPTKLKMLSYFLSFINIFKTTMRLPSVGEPFRLMYARDFAFTGDANSTEALIEQSLQLAHGHGCNFLSFPLDPQHPLTAVLTEYKPIKTTYHIHARSLTNEPLAKPTTIYVDPADL